MLTLTLFLIFATMTLMGYAVIPLIYNRTALINESRRQKISANMEQLLPRHEARRMGRLFVITPFFLAGLFYFLFPEELKLIGVIIGFVGGFVFPGFYMQMLTGKTKDKFSDQLVDALMIMSSSFRGGLSLVQAMEAVVEEMPDPINREFSTVLGENKMGVSLDEALSHLYQRMTSASLQQMITAILLARETGGNLPVIFSRIVTNIRERKKIQQNLDTLTIQGKIQGFVMTLLPIAFGYVVYTSNRRIFEHMFVSEMGRAMLIYAVVSEVIGAFLIWKISTFKDF